MVDQKEQIKQEAKQLDADIDKEAGGGMRELKGKQGMILAAVAAGLSLFSLYVNAFTNMQEIYRNVSFLAFLFVLVFLLYPAVKKGKKRRLACLILDLLF